MGFDDNGLPTERLVEKTYNVKACDLAKEEFLELFASYIYRNIKIASTITKRLWN